MLHASTHAVFERRPRTDVIDQSMVEPVANSSSNLNQFLPVVRNHFKKNDKAISGHDRLTVAVITVQPLSHTKAELHYI